MNTKNMVIEFSSSLSNIVEINSSFDAAKLRIAYTGKNRNNTFISKESFEQAIPTMYNCPIVANYMRESDEIGSHDGEFIKDKNGKTKYVNITQPVGVVPESAQYNWETVDDNGVIHEYLCADVILWKRQEAYQKLKNDGITDQSMEIAVHEGEMVDGCYNIKDFSFTAFCLLGTAEPCFESAALFTFSTEDFKQQYTEMMKEFKAAFSITGVTNKKGEENLKLKELLKKYKVCEADLEFEHEGLSDEELEAKFKEAYETNKKKGASEDDPPDESDADDDSDNEEIEDEPDDNDGSGDDASESDDSDAEFALSSQEYESLHDAVCAEKIETDWGAYSRYWLVDYDTSLKEVYFYDYEDGKLYGCPFKFNGDDAIVDFKKCKKKKYAIVDYVEGAEQEFSVKGLIESFNTAYSAASKDMEKINEELSQLREFKKEVLAERRETDEAALFEKFEAQLQESDEFKALKSNSKDYSMEALEKELFVLVGKMNFSFSKDNITPMIAVKNDSAEESNDEFGSLFAWKKEEEN